MYDSNAMGIGITVAFAGMGVTFESMVETKDSLVMYVTVPEHSYCKDVNGVEMCGKHLAYRCKKALEANGLKNLVIKSKTRYGESWTEENEKVAQENMKKKLLKSQY